MSKAFQLPEIPQEVFDNMAKIENLVGFKKLLIERKQESLDQSQAKIDLIKEASEGLGIDVTALENARDELASAFDQIILLSQKALADMINIDQSAGK